MGKRVSRRDLAKEQRWRELVAKHRASDLSVREFCANAGVAENSFYAWRRELALRDAESADGADVSEPKKLKRVSTHPKRKPSTSSSGAAAFVLVTLSSLPSASAVEVTLPSGVTLRVAAGCDEATLRSRFGSSLLPRNRPTCCLTRHRMPHPPEPIPTASMAEL